MGLVENAGVRSQEAWRVAAQLSEFHASLPAYAATPLRELPRLAAEFGVARVFVKDETARMGLPSFKILGASWAVAMALYSQLQLSDIGDLTFPKLQQAVAGSDLTLVTATDGNHGRAVARMAHLLGISAVIFVPSSLAAVRIRPIEEEGATIVRWEGDYDSAVCAAADWSEARSNTVLVQDTSWAGYEDVPEQVVVGYDTILRELDQQLVQNGVMQPDVVVVQMGVGSFASAVVSHYGSGIGKPVFIGVEPESAACVAQSIAARKPVVVPGPHDSAMSGLNCGTVSELAWPILRDGLSFCTTISDPQAEDGVRSLYQGGIAAGECSGAAPAGIRELIAHLEGDQARVVGHDAVIVLFATEGVADQERFEEVVMTVNRD